MKDLNAIEKRAERLSFLTKKIRMLGLIAAISSIVSAIFAVAAYAQVKFEQESSFVAIFMIYALSASTLSIFTIFWRDYLRKEGLSIYDSLVEMSESHNLDESELFELKYTLRDFVRLTDFPLFEGQIGTLFYAVMAVGALFGAIYTFSASSY